MLGRESSPVMWEGPPTDKIERSGKVNGKQGKGLGDVRILVCTILSQFYYLQLYGRTYCTVDDKTRYTVDSGKKEKGKR